MHAFQRLRHDVAAQARGTGDGALAPMPFEARLEDVALVGVEAIMKRLDEVHGLV